MKKTILFSLLATAIAVCSSSCTPKDTPPPPVPVPVESKAEVTLMANGDPDFPSTSIGFELKATNLESYVYQIEEGENKETPEPIVLYAEEADRIHPITADGISKVTVYGMEGDKAYTVHFAFKIKGETKYLSKSLSSKTPAYTQLINVISADRREIKVQFNAAPDQYYRYAIVNRYGYNDMRYQFHQGDVDFLQYFGAPVSKGSKVITYADGKPSEILDPETGEPVIATVKPGTGFVILYAECDENGEILIEQAGGGGGGVDPLLTSPIKPNVKNYTEKCADDWYVFVNKYAKYDLWTAPFIEGEGKFGIEKVKITERSASFKITPPASVSDYGVAIMPLSMYDQAVEFAGEDGVINALLTEATQPASGVQTVTIEDRLEKDSTYILLVIGVCDRQIGEVQIAHIERFTPIVSTKPASELVITAVPSANPYKVEYNVKAPAGDCAKAIYVMNYVKDWAPMIKGGVTYEQMVLQYGAKNLLDIAQVNSAAGLTMTFNSWEDTESLLAVVSYSAEEKIKTFTQVARSATEPAKTRVESDLFTSLQGTWNVNYKFFLGKATVVTESNFTTVIAGKPETESPTFAAGDKEYDALFKYHKAQAIKIGNTEAEAIEYATKQNANMLADYKESTAKFAKKYRDQNRLVMRGFKYNAYAGLAYRSPWELCCDIYYSSYDVDQTFYDYGSKLFLEIRKDKDGKDEVTLETNSSYIAPLSNYTGNTFFVGGINGTGILGGQFPVQIVDANTIRIKHEIVYNEVPYKFITAYASNTGTYLHTTATADIELTRVTTPAAAPRMSYTLPEISGGLPIGYNAPIVYKRTALPTYLKEKPVMVIPMTKAIKSKTFKMGKSISRR